MKKILPTKFRNQNGMTELLIVLGIAVVGGIMMSTSATMVNRATQDGRSANQKSGAQDLKREMEVFLSLPSNCAANFRNIIPDAPMAGTARTQAIKDNALTDIFKLGADQDYMNGLLRIKDWTIEEDGRVLEVGPPQVSVVNIKLNLERQGGTGPQIIQRKVSIVATKVGGAGTAIDECYGLVGNDSDLWIRASGMGDRIYSAVTGNVGIGTETPAQKLDVVGDSLIVGNHLADSLTSLGTVTTNDQLNLSGNLGINVANPTRRLDVLGDTHVTGNKTVTGLTSVQALNQLGDLEVANDLTVTGRGNLQRLTNSGTATVGGTALFGQAANFASTARFSSLAVGTNNFAPAGTALSVVGDLDVSVNVNATRVSANNICTGGDCRTTFATQACPGGMIRQINSSGVMTCENATCSGVNAYLMGLNGSGSPVCGVLPNQACSATNEYIQSANPLTGAVVCRSIPSQAGSTACTGRQLMVEVSGGNAQCVDPSIAGGPCSGGRSVIGQDINGTAICGPPARSIACAAGQISRGINSDGSVVCQDVVPSASTCAAGYVLRGLNSDGTPRCVLKPTFTAISCPTGQVVRSISSTGVPTCGSASVIDSCPVSNTSMAGLGPNANPVGCKCNQCGSVWNGSSCQAPRSCSGGWGACSATCGGGTQTYTIATTRFGGAANCPTSDCPYLNGQTRACNTQACPTLCWKANPPTLTGLSRAYVNPAGRYECLLSGSCANSGETRNAEKCNEYNVNAGPPPAGSTFLGSGWRLYCDETPSLNDSECVGATTGP